MNQGTDLSTMFLDILKVSQHEDIKVKKISYIFIMEYAQKNNDLAILAINTILKDTEDPNPVIRSLAVRTIGDFDLNLYGDYLCNSVLLTLLKDNDPYVRKSAVLCVSKIYSKNPDLLTKYHILDAFYNCLVDGNPFVVANTLRTFLEMINGIFYLYSKKSVY